MFILSKFWAMFVNILFTEALGSKHKYKVSNIKYHVNFIKILEKEVKC